MFRIARRALAMLTTFGLVVLTLLACVQRPALVIETSTGDIVPLEAWTATLSSASAGLKGTATLAPGVTYRETVASLSLSGATPGAVHGWFIQLGQCGYNRGILAGPQAYPAVIIDGDGAGRSIVTLPFTVPTNGDFSVNLRQSASDATSVVACGNLTKVRPAGEPTVAATSAP